MLYTVFIFADRFDRTRFFARNRNINDCVIRTAFEMCIRDSGMSGVGISFGADRIFDVLNQLDLYPKEAVNGTELLFVNFGDKEAAYRCV